MNRRLRPELLHALALCCLLPTAATALEGDRRQPIEFEAGHFDGVVAADGETRLSQGFTLIQGTLRIRSEDALITRKAGEFVRIQLSGAPATVEQQLDSGGRMHAEARDIDYNIGSDELLLTGSVVVTQPEGALRGERVRYDIGSGHIEGGGGGGRIRMRIEPKTESPAAAPAELPPADSEASR